MKFQFKIQPFQTEAVESVVNVFSGQPNMAAAEYTIDRGVRYITVNGRRVRDSQQTLGLDDLGHRNADVEIEGRQLLENLHKAQDAHGIPRSKDMDNSLGRCQLDIEMETGTGKTYVYTKTMFELHKHYGWTKFIIVVPSVAIREGVRKSLEMTQEHFMQTYGRKLRYFVYNSDNLQEIEQFSQSADIYVMIINMQAFNTSLREGANNKAARIIYDRRDEFGSRRPIDVISANRPVVILDEPQKMGGDATQKALRQFKPLFTLNYSATHKQVHNPVFQLDALDAFNRHLVKKIEVVGFELRNLQGTSSYLYFEDIELSKDKPPQARINFETQLKSGTIKRTTRRFRVKDDLQKESGLKGYEGFVITEIDARAGRVTFLNGVTLQAGEAYGDITAEQKARIQIRQTIKAHLRKERKLFRQGIKTLSLFFIDEVKNYREYDMDGRQQTGLYGRMFEEEYKDLVEESKDSFEPDYSAYLRRDDATRIHAGYFSIDKKGHAVNSKEKKDQGSDDISAYDLIMKDKERLLSFAEPVRFIFSHSALREGWDNPNVFQICSLRQSGSTVQKRQEVGRGLRLCVNNQGARMDSETLGESVHDINRLTVIASEGYADFVKGLQEEISADLYDRPTKVDANYFAGKQVTLPGGETHVITKEEANKIHNQLIRKDYIDDDDKPTDAFRKAAEEKTLQPLANELAPLSDAVYKAVQAIFDPSVLSNMVEKAPKTQIKDNKPNDNFNKKEFRTLWDSINHRYAYRVAFDSGELIDKAVAALNEQLKVSELYYIVETGEQTDNATKEQMDSGTAFTAKETLTERLRVTDVSNVKYDLLGTIAERTKLTRRTVATILSRISPAKFDLYRSNPEEFLAKTARIIVEQKATMIVEHIAYNRVEGTFSNDIFTENHSDYAHAFPARKSITPYVFCDGTAEESNERKFLRELEKAKEVVVYAKLPRGFHIPTPVGNYSPDWAIAFNEKSVKHVYFVAETKGSMSTLQLRDIEKAKIACAKKLFKTLLAEENVTYDMVNNYEELLNIVKG